MATNKGRGGKRQVTKDDIRALKKAGLYSGSTRKEPTRYAKRLVEQYRDVINGNAKAITIRPVKKGDSKGIVAARAKARELAAEYDKTIRAKGNKIIVRTSRKDEKVYYSPVADTIVTQYKDALGRKIEHEYVRQKVSRDELEEEADGEPDTLEVLQAEQLPAIGPNQTYALPLSRGYHGVDYEYRATRKEILDLAYAYEGATKRRKDGSVVSNPYRDAVGHIQVVSIDAPRRRRRKPKAKATDKPKASTKRSASNFVPFKKPRK